MKALCSLSCAQIVSAEYAFSESYVSGDFFSKWTFWSASDPAKGFVEYVDFSAALEADLISAASDRVYIGADMKAKVAGTGRPSIRIQSKATYNQGLFIVRLDHLPTGCGVWPALWMYGEDENHLWPHWGEYDIIEGVHNANQTMTTLHTGPHCNQSRVREGKDFAGRWKQGLGVPADNCDVHAPSQWRNQGCSQQGPDASMGESFNAGGGGTYAAEWDPGAGHFRTWFWPRGSEPVDLIEGRPSPDSWHMPYSYFSLDPDTCEPRHFTNMRLVFDISFCGDLGDPTFADSCGATHRNMTCQEFVAFHPEAMQQAYWSIRSLDVYLRGIAVSPTGTPKSGPPPSPPTLRRPRISEGGSSWTPTVAIVATFWAILVVVALYVKVWRKVHAEAPVTPMVRDFMFVYAECEPLPSKAPNCLDLVEEDPWSQTMTHGLAAKRWPLPASTVAMLSCWAPQECAEGPHPAPMSPRPRHTMSPRSPRPRNTMSPPTSPRPRHTMSL